MRVLSLWQPWATLCVAPDPAYAGRRPAKTVETRGWQPTATLPLEVAIHATKKMDGDVLPLFAQWPFRDCLERCGYYPGDPRPWLAKAIAPPRGLAPLPLGAIVGVAVIARVRRAQDFVDNGWAWAARFERALGAPEDAWREEQALGDYGKGRFGFVLMNQVALPTPVPFSGRQDVLYDLPYDIEEAVRTQVAIARRAAPAPVPVTPLSTAQWRTLPPVEEPR